MAMNKDKKAHKHKWCLSINSVGHKKRTKRYVKFVDRNTLINGMVALACEHEKGIDEYDLNKIRKAMAEEVGGVADMFLNSSCCGCGKGVDIQTANGHYRMLMLTVNRYKK